LRWISHLFIDVVAHYHPHFFVRYSGM
jgi:hypothetical protein